MREDPFERVDITPGKGRGSFERDDRWGVLPGQLLSKIDTTPETPAHRRAMDHWRSSWHRPLVTPSGCRAQDSRPPRATVRVRKRVQRDQKPQFVLRIGLDETWYRIPESRQTSGGFRLSTVVTVGSGQIQGIPTGLRVRMRVRNGRPGHVGSTLALRSAAVPVRGTRTALPGRKARARCGAPCSGLASRWDVTGWRA